jgi:hypothetical protein
VARSEAAAPLGKLVDIVVEDLLGLGAIDASVPVEIAQEFFLLRIDTEDGIAGGPIFRPQSGDVFELGMAFGTPLDRQVLLGPCVGRSRAP